MCGITGLLGRQAVAGRLVEALTRLEYRGYDSAGIATLENGSIHRVRATGELKHLDKKVSDTLLSGTCGIGHTRWATHGRPTEENAHPHATEELAVAHNGIIENYRELKEELEKGGVTFKTQTDTEVVVHLATKYVKAGQEPLEAVRSTLARLRGQYALVFLFRGNEEFLIVARKGSPLAIGRDAEGTMSVGSDAIAVGAFSEKICYLEDGDYGVVTPKSVCLRDASGRVVERMWKKLEPSQQTVDKGNYDDFMLKEIYEQPEMVSHTIDRYTSEDNSVRLPVGVDLDFTEVSEIAITACGTAYLAGSIAKYFFERYAKMMVFKDVASEFRYADVPLRQGGVSLFISQSGETADTLASLHYAKHMGQKTVAIVNVMESTIGREADVKLQTMAGPEIGVASTKAFTCQVTLLALLAIYAGRQRGVLTLEEEKELVRDLRRTPSLMSQALGHEEECKEVAERLKGARDVYFVGRNTNAVLAQEGALKFKEITYIPTEGYAAGELKHGPIALLDKTKPVVVIAPHDEVLTEKTWSNMQEVSAREALVYLLTDEKSLGTAPQSREGVILLPETSRLTSPMVYAVVLQLIAYHTAKLLKRNIDKPRNLAKSVTVE